MVWGHSGVTQNQDIVIHAFHMPVFFFLSGYLFNQQMDIRRKIDSLLIPYFVFGTGLFAVWKIMGKIIALPVNYSISDYIQGIVGINTIISPYACIQWFLTCLFLTEILFFYFESKCTNDVTLAFVLVFFSVVGFFWSAITDIRLFWGLDTAFTAVVFYGCGHLLKKSQRKLREFFSGKTNTCLWRFSVILLTVIIAVWSTWKNGYVNMRTLQYGNYFLYYLSAFSIIALIIYMSMIVSGIRWIRNRFIYRLILYFGENTLVILVINQVFNQLLNWFIKPDLYTLTGGNESWIDFCCTVLVMIVMIPIIYAINRFLPFLIGKKHT